MLIRRMPPGFLPVPPRWGIILPSLLMRCIFLVFELSQGWQCLLEVRSMPNWHRIGTNCVRTNPPIVTVHTNFFWSDVVRVIFVRQFVHLTTHFFSATDVKHVLSELLVSDEPVKDTSRTYSCISSWASSRRSTRDHLASSRNGARGVVLFSCSN